MCEAGGAELFALENCTNVSPRETLVLVKITLEAARERGCVHGIAGARGMGLRTCTNVSPRGTLVLVKTRLRRLQNSKKRGSLGGGKSPGNDQARLI